jgi:hypothetical protein
MNRPALGRWIMTFVLVAGAVVSTAVDWNDSHLFNPAWHPHARFHDALFLMIVDAMTLVTLWLLWRRGPEPEIGFRVAALFAAAVWTPFFYIEALIPGTSLLASDNVPVVRVGGLALAPNLVVAIVMVLLTLVAHGLGRESARRG